MKLGPVLVVGLALAGCKKGGSVAEKQAASLWTLAPADAQGGVVLAPGAAKELRAGVNRWLALAARHPAGAPLVEKLRGELQVKGVDPLDGPAFAAKSGLDLDRGAAVFLAGGEVVRAVLPVVDRAAFRRFVAATGETRDGLEVDVVDELVCGVVSGRYLCAADVAGLRAEAKDSPLAAKAAALPRHGELETLFLVPGGSPLPMFGVPTLVHAVLDLDADGFSVRAWSDPKPTKEGQSLLSSKPSSEALARLRGATGAGRMVLPLELLKGFLPPDAPLLPGLDARRDVADVLTGEIVFLTRGKHFSASALIAFVTDPARARASLEKACAAVPFLKWQAGVCSGELPGPQPTRASASVDDKALVVTFDDPGPAEGTPPSELAGHADAREILTGAWSLSGWGTSWDLLAALPPGTLEPLLAVAPDEVRDNFAVFDLVSYLAASVYEIGLGVGLRDDGVHALFRVTTLGEDEAFASALAKRAAGDFAGYRAAMAGLGKSPGLLGRQAKLAGEERAVVGLPSVAVIGMLAAVAVPAYTKYLHKAKTVEAVRSIKRMFEGAIAYYREHGKYPVASGTASSEPPGTCCQQAGGRCPPDPRIAAASPWQELGLAFDEPRQFTLQYESDEEGASFTARAMGDLDCDGVYSTYEMVGKVDAQGQPTGSAGIYRENELE